MIIKNLGIAFLFLGIFLMLSGNVSATICYCDSCESCTNQLNNPNCKEVRLTKSIINHAGTCINNPVHFNNKIFDCMGNTIDGDDQGRDYGIYTSGRNFNTIRNCRITNFYDGIYLSYSSNNRLINNTANNNSRYGIYLSYSSNNRLINNTANNNRWRGISLYYSSNNILTNNIANNNRVKNGIYLESSSNNTLTNNIANNNDWSGILLYNSSNNTLTHNTANNNNLRGIHLSSSSNNNTITSNTMKNNTLSGILLSYSSNNTLTNNIADNNNWSGIYLDNADNNNFTLNIVRFNRRHGFYTSLLTSTGNILNSNIFCSNNQSGGAFYDIYNLGAHNRGDDNTCNTTFMFNDAGTMGCTYRCLGYPSIFFVQVNNVGGAHAIRRTPYIPTPENNVLKSVPNGWVLNVINTYQNNYISGRYIWWEVEDVTDGVRGWTQYKRISDGTEYLKIGNQEELRNKTKKLDRKEDRIPVIVKAVEHYYNDRTTTPSLYSGNDGDNKFSIFKDNDFPIELIFAMIKQESGGVEFDNEVIGHSACDWGRGIMQVDWDTNVGKGSGIRWYNKGVVDYCRRAERVGKGKDRKCVYHSEYDKECHIHPLSEVDQFFKNYIYCDICKHYYTNSYQGIYANIKDGLRTLQYFLNSAMNLKTCIIPDDISGEGVTCDDVRRAATLVGYNTGEPRLPPSDYSHKVGPAQRYLNRISLRLNELNDEFGPFGYNNRPDLAKKIETISKNIKSIRLYSPGDLQIYDSQGRTTGLVNGSVKEEIPNSIYFHDSKTIVIFFPSDFYRYIVVGTDNGTYELEVISNRNGSTNTFIIIDVPTANNTVHEYIVVHA